jgi:hypothetical protein
VLYDPVIVRDEYIPDPVFMDPMIHRDEFDPAPVLPEPETLIDA